jgi:hypothetical protein
MIYYSLSTVLSPVLADVIWPSLFLEQMLLSIPVIAAGLIVEFFFVWRYTKMSIARSIGADILMNASSTLLGILLIPFTGFLWSAALDLTTYGLNAGDSFSTFSYVGWAGAFVLAVLVNAAIETFVLSKGFKQEMGKRGFGWLCIANALSVGIAMLSFLTSQ